MNLLKQMFGMDNGITKINLDCLGEYSLISVIIPTMLKCSEITAESLISLCSSRHVGEVIIINNTPHSISYLNIISNKIKVLDMGGNIYVNPAWNLGVEVARYSVLSIINDDVILDNSIFDRISSCDLLKYGILGMHKQNFYNKKCNQTISFYESYKMNFGFGTAMFFHKKNYFNIPEDLKIYCGDSYLYDMNSVSGRKNIAINMNVKTIMSATSSSAEFNKIKKSDLLLYKKYTPLK
jgi:hypothetical protein